MKTFRIDPELKAIFIEYSGTMVDSDLLIGVEEYASLGPPYVVLIDLSAVESFEVTSAGLRTLAQRSGGPQARARCAVVASTPLAFGLGRMFEAFCEMEASDRGVAVFRDAASARQWIGLPAQDAPITAGGPSVDRR